MDDLRDSFSRLKKGVKHRFAGSKRDVDKPGGNGSNADNENVAPSPTAGESRPDWKSTASASAKLLLRGVRDSADAFPPLKSVAGGLCFILENCEVQFPLPPAIQKAYRYPSE